MALRTSMLIAAIGCALTLSACAGSKGGPIPYQDLAAPDAPTVQTLAADYKIAPLDKLAIKVFRMPDLSGDYDVDLAGNVSLPLVGDVAAVQLTPAELDDKLTQLFGAKYLVNPDISVGIKESSSRIVTVDGSVRNPGNFPVLSRLSLMQAIAQVGGLSDEANSRRVAIFRTIDGKRQAAAFDLSAIRKGEVADPRIYAGDIIVVDGSGVKAIQKNLISSIPLLNLFTVL